jgi:predicted dehydrogenase
MGKHVIVEKPLATTLEQANSLIEECKKRKVKLAAIFQERFHESSQQLKKAADEGRFGVKFLGSAYIKWYRLQEYYDASGGWRGT